MLVRCGEGEKIEIISNSYLFLYDSIITLYNDEDSKELINKWIEKRNLKKLAYLWIKGVSIDWNLLYSNNDVKRISLPTYPFVKEKYYFSMNKNLEVFNNEAIATNVIHPLLHSNMSDFSCQKFTSRYSGNEIFIKDYLVNGQVSLNEALYLEMARAAIEFSTVNLIEEKSIIILKNVELYHNIFNNRESLDIKLDLNDLNEVEYEITSFPDEGNKHAVLCCKGAAILSTQLENVSRLNIQDILENCKKKEVSSKEVYTQFDNIGVNYKVAYQGIEKIYIGKDQGLARLVIPKKIMDENNKFVLHPSIISSVLQVAAVIVGNTEDVHDITINEVPYEFGIEQLNIYEKCYGEMWAYIRKDTEINDSYDVMYIELCDSNGDVAVNMKLIINRPKVKEYALSRESKIESIKNKISSIRKSDINLNTFYTDKYDKNKALTTNVQKYLIELTSKLLSKDFYDIDIEEELWEYGFDKILLNKFLEQIYNNLNINLELSIFIEKSTIEKLAEFIVKEYSDKIIEIFK